MENLNEQQEIRLLKMQRLRERGIEPYPARAERTHTAREVAENVDALAGQEVTVTGRLLERRDMGKSVFADLEDGSGKVQLFLRMQTAGTETLELVKADLDRGDIVQAMGVPMRTRAGEPSVEVRGLTLLSKTLNVPPDRHYGVEDVEMRYRQRYVDQIGRAHV